MEVTYARASREAAFPRGGEVVAMGIGSVDQLLTPNIIRAYWLSSCGYKKLVVTSAGRFE